MLFLLILSILALESAHSIRFLYRHFLSGITTKSLNAFYYACSYAKVDCSGFMNVTAKIALHLIPESLKSQPVFICIDDTMVSKFGLKFENVSKLFDHAAHNGSNYLNGHCFVSLMLCIPVWNHDKISYLAVPLGYRMWQKKEKVGDYYTGVRRVLTNLFGTREVLAYVTSTARTGGTKRLFFSTISPEELQIFCAWQESSPLNQTGSDQMKYIPLFLYSFRWNIEISYYEQKTFWSLCSYMVRSCKGIEMMINLINVAYCAMKLLPYQDESFSDFRNNSVQDFRFALSEGIRQQVFFATLVQNIETQIKSSSMINALKQAIVKQEHYL